MVYRFTLNAETARTLSEIPAQAHAALGARGMASATRPATAHSRHTRTRAATGSSPRLAHRNDNQPPANPPIMAASGGSQAKYAASTNVRCVTSTRYRVVQLLQSEYVTMLSALAAMNPHM